MPSTPTQIKRRRRVHKLPPDLTPVERETLLAVQGNRCAICGASDEKLFVDHSYRTGATRGLLCRACNSACGLFKDSPTRLRRALKYLGSPPGKALQTKQVTDVA